MSDEKVGVVFKYFQGAGVAAIEVTGRPVKQGDTVQFLGFSTNFNEKINSIQSEGKDVGCASAGDKVGIAVSDRVRPGDVVYMVEEAGG